MNFVVAADVAAWRDERVPEHLAFAMRNLVDEDEGATLDTLASIPFYSLCTGLLLPLSGMAAEKARWLFGLDHAPPSAQEREALLQTFLAKDVGLDLVQKLACVLGDPYRGRPSTMRRDSLVTLLLSVVMKTRRELVDRLSIVGDVAVLYAEARPAGSGDPQLTAAEVIETLRFTRQKGLGRARKFRIVRGLLMRCGKLEAYFLAKLVMRKAGFGFDYQGALIARVLGEHFQAPAEQVAHAMALTDAFEVMRVLSAHGVEGLRAIRLQPLVPVRPALASGSVDGVKRYPVWVERKYDGIRFMLHKSTDARGSVLCGAYTRNRRDWMDLVSGLRAAIQAIPCRDCIIDGELYGTVMDLDGARPATVYEVYSALQGDRARPVNMKFAAFDLVYLNGQDLTQSPLSERRRVLQMVLGPLATYPLPVPLEVADGQLCDTAEDVKRLYGHFRNQGYEGIIAKDLAGSYVLAARDPTWLKRKPMVTLDLVLLGAVFAVTEKTNAGLFGSYVIGARTPEGSFVDVGDVAGVDRIKDQQIQHEVMREGLITGQRIERKSASGVRSGMDLRPHIVVTVKFEGIIKDSISGDLKLRDPKLVAIRSDKSAAEADKIGSLEQIWLRHRVG